jgi:chemotaxis protein CheD
MTRVHHVKIGEVKVGKKGDTLKAILGSCIGIAFIWKERKICGLAHCLLPESPNRLYNVGARFVTQAIPSLIALMKIKPEDFAEIEVVVVGGGNMTSFEKNEDKIVGAVNSQTALSTLQKTGLRVSFQDVGGTEGRQIEIDCDQFSYEVRRIPRIAA